MHDEHELLEMAAKAAGVADVGEWFDSDEGPYFVVGSKVWDPITDDGDALRLAVKLNLHICIDAESSGVITVEWGFDEGGSAAFSVEEFSHDEEDDLAATRRAIVRAAAAIGEAMQ